ncbi:hypothetical protein FRC02_001432, partial [Tulasnella sp. 418]
KAVFTAYLNSMEILERPPPPPGPSKQLSSPLSRKLAALREAKQKHKDRDADVPVGQPPPNGDGAQPPTNGDAAQPQHSPDDAGVTDRNAAAGKGEGTSRKRKR